MITTEELLAKAGPQIAGIGSAFYLHADTLAVGRKHGLDAFGFYFLGRGGVLGDVESVVVASAFGYFHGDLVEQMWSTARSRTSLSPREAGRRYFACAADFGRQTFADLDLEAFCGAAAAVNSAADPAGLALYAGISAEPLADDPPARAMQLCTVLREFRGSAHLLAVLATAGIDPGTAHGVRRPDFWTIFGYPETDLPVATDSLLAALSASDALTDDLVRPAFDVLPAAERSALLDGLAAMEAAIAG